MKKRAAPEHRLQVQVKRFLTYALPQDVEWTSSLAGAYLGPTQRMKAVASGLRPGFPDLMFILPGGRVTFIELKTDKGVLSADQRRIRDRCRSGDWALCRSVEDVERTLWAWGLKLRAKTVELFGAFDAANPFANMCGDPDHP